MSGGIQEINPILNERGLTVDWTPYIDQVEYVLAHWSDQKIINDFCNARDELSTVFNQTVASEILEEIVRSCLISHVPVLTEEVQNQVLASSAYRIFARNFPELFKNSADVIIQRALETRDSSYNVLRLDVEVKVDVEANMVSICLRDNGPGFPEGMLKHFETKEGLLSYCLSQRKATKSHLSVNYSFGGMGLGLRSFSLAALTGQDLTNKGPVMRYVPDSMASLNIGNGPTGGALIEFRTSLAPFTELKPSNEVFEFDSDSPTDDASSTSTGSHSSEEVGIDDTVFAAPAAARTETKGHRMFERKRPPKLKSDLKLDTEETDQEAELPSFGRATPPAAAPADSRTEIKGQGMFKSKRPPMLKSGLKLDTEETEIKPK